MKRACYRCDKLGAFRISWLRYQKGPHAHDYACADHAGQSQQWGFITRSTEAVRW